MRIFMVGFSAEILHRAGRHAHSLSACADVAGCDLFGKLYLKKRAALEVYAVVRAALCDQGNDADDNQHP